MTYRQWAAGLAQDIETVAIQLPGREGRMGEAFLDRTEDIVASVAHAIRPFLDGRPLALFGHSMGGLVALELARAPPSVDQEALLRWSVETTGPFRLHMFRGDHFFIRPFRSGVTRVIDESLARVR